MKWPWFDRHPSPTALVDLLEGGGRRASRRHVERCAECDRSLTALAATRSNVAADQVPEPPAYFWQQLSAGVAGGVDRITREAEMPTRRALASLRPAFVFAAASGLVVAVGAAALLWRAPRPVPGSSDAPDSVATASPAAAADVEWPELSESIEAVGSWGVVLTLAEEIDIDQASEVGIGPSLGSTDNAVSQLSPDERTELVRLIREEIGSV